MTSEPQILRYAFLPAWRLQTSLTTAGVMAIMIVKSLLLGRPIDRPDILINLGIAAFCGVCIAVIISQARFTLSPDGLRTFSTFGTWATLPWAAIAHVRPARYYFLPHLRLTVDGESRIYWLPLVLEDMDALRQAVAAHAGQDHPMYRALPSPAREARRLDR